jgi:hypothetical protein
VTSWLGGILVVLSLGVGAEAAGSSCAEACYQQKTEAYQRCRKIPPASRAERARCFREADQALQRCLRSCR